MAAHQAPPSLGFSRQEHWSGLPFPSPTHESESEVVQSCPTLSDPMDCSLPGCSIHRIFQARVLECHCLLRTTVTYTCKNYLGLRTSLVVQWLGIYFPHLSVQFSSVAESCPNLCDSMNHSTPGLPVHHQLPEFTQTHVHQVRDAIQPSHPLSSPSPPAPNPSQHQSLFQ